MENYVKTFSQYVNKVNEAKEIKDPEQVENDVRKIMQKYNLSYMNTLFDPVQTHSLSGIHESDMANLKTDLSDVGCTNFRVVKKTILCFKIKGFKND